MAKRKKKVTKQRSRMHRKWVAKKRKVRKRAASKIGYGQRRRRQKKLNKK